MAIDEIRSYNTVFVQQRSLPATFFMSWSSDQLATPHLNSYNIKLTLY